MKNCLNGEWDLKGNGFNCQVSIPGDFYSALVKNGFLPDPYYGDNEQIYQSVNKADWDICRKFSYSAIPGTRVFLEINEIDTIFTCFINGQEAGKGDNFFIRHRFDVTDLIKNGENEIKIHFESAEMVAEKINAELPYPVPYNGCDVISPNRNLVRKCQCHSGWDWGPALMVSGIYKDIFLETVTDGLFDSIMMNYEETDEGWDVLCDVEFIALDADIKEFAFKIDSDDIVTDEPSIIKEIHLSEGTNHITVRIPVKNAVAWKTAGELREEGLKENPLYNISVSFEDKLCGKKEISRKFAFSSLKCRSPKESDGGRALFFENNGRRIYAKGANWIPADALPSRAKPEVYRDLLTSLVEANMNCVRVWGGGIYERDGFYELCDRLGIIVWQDFMFACALYPVTKSFMANVEKEVVYQVKRLQFHPALGLWCGNNENFGALTWFPESREKRDRYLVDYDRLYNGLIGRIVQDLDPSRLWWPSSPCAGPDDFADNWHQDNMGDMHFWSVWHERRNFDAYLSIKPRFVSEFGYQSFPSIETIKTYCPEDQLNFSSPMNDYHQRSPCGNAVQLENFARYFRFPNGFENMIYLSQVQQATAIRTALDYWRSLMPYCMGSIVWQLNDVWPGPSWSSIEYGGKWKLLHYAEKVCFEPVHLSVFVQNDKLQVFCVNDNKAALEKASVKVACMNFAGKTVFEKVISADGFGGDTSKCIFEMTKDNLAEETGLKLHQFFVYAVLEGQCDGKEVVSRQTFFMDLFKRCDLEKPELKLDFTATSDGVEISLQSEKPAFFVTLDSHKIKGKFSDNGFTVIPGKVMKVFFVPEDKISLKELKEQMTIQSLRDSY